MSNRFQSRKTRRILDAVIRKAKVDMAKWLETLTVEPTTGELNAFKAGYLYGLNRSNSYKEDK